MEPFCRIGVNPRFGGQGGPPMRAMNIITLILLVIGGLNWLLVGLFQFDLVAAIFGGETSVVSRIIYILVGLSALWQLMPLFKSFSEDEALAQRHSPSEHRPDAGGRSRPPESAAWALFLYLKTSRAGARRCFAL